MSVIDICLYHNEEELLDLRFEVLRSVVDLFIVVEGDLTFQGKKRETTDPKTRKIAIGGGRKVAPIMYYLATLPEEAESPWEREKIQRNAMKFAAIEHTYPDRDHLIMISDVDEIPKPEAVREASLWAGLGHVVCFQQIHSYYQMNLVDQTESWFGTRALTSSMLEHTTPHDIRSVVSYEGQHLIEDGGWHFGWLGDKEKLRQKVAAFSHADLNSPAVMSDAHLDSCFRRRVTIHNGHQLSVTPITKLPSYVQRNIDKYREHLIL